ACELFGIWNVWTAARLSTNHHRYARSAVASRVGKSPRELLTGERHAHWLSLLGYSPFASASDN
ncbi:MAG TPA: hypothetical protein PLY87_27025, partial [Planctomycetaceae bacterium]|nr:hypothetical protein [Planctomycetaceae bacterium]